MISKEQIAHDLTMVYMKNLYGVDISGELGVIDGDGTGSIRTKHLPDPDEPEYIKVKTGEKGFLGIEKKEKVQTGYKVDALFTEMTDIYFYVYEKFYTLVCERDQ